MTLTSCSARHLWRLGAPRYLRQPSWINLNLLAGSQPTRRCFYDGGQALAVEEAVAEEKKLEGRVDPGFWKEYKESYDVPRPTFEFRKQIPLSEVGPGQLVTAVGFLGPRRNMGTSMTFAQLLGGTERIQVLARSELSEDARVALRSIKPFSAVSVTGFLNLKYEAKDPKHTEQPKEGTAFISQLEIRLQSIKSLNSFPNDILLNKENVFDPEDRHLQLRFDPELRERLKFRSDVAAFARRELADFQEIETPILFKSTPEGAREFIVPTRHKGHAYALPQSPQQYKQILMASGINRYVQFAKCFRDEDHRADRQPEFTQIDLEMAWANGEDVMRRVEQFVKSLWKEFARPGTAIESSLAETPFIRMTYGEAMSKHGSDKPDLRIRGLIHRIDHILPAELCGMLTSIQDPLVEAFKFRLDGDTKTVQKFVREFMDSPDAEPFRETPDGPPGIFVFDLRRPLEGLQGFGFEGAENIKNLYIEASRSHGATDTEFDDGDLLLIQARPNLPHNGGSTTLGKLRLAIYKAAVAQGLVAPDPTHHFLWVTDFPMFTLENGTDPGQGGAAGFSATHHPFTAPKTAVDVDLLLTDPLKAKADHYDLVLNGVELGGGSRRIHSSHVQTLVLKDILKIAGNKVEHNFGHLLKALRAGCPPHAGLAIGFDRLVAVMQGRETVRDVIAFPKNAKGEDRMVGSPSRITADQMKNYSILVHEWQERGGNGLRSQSHTEGNAVFERIVKLGNPGVKDEAQEQAKTSPDHRQFYSVRRHGKSLNTPGRLHERRDKARSLERLRLLEKHGVVDGVQGQEKAGMQSSPGEKGGAESSMTGAETVSDVPSKGEGRWGGGGGSI